MRIGIFGGTFDPPHLGHLILAGEAFAQLQLDQLLWVLTPDPPHKQDRTITPCGQRIALVQAALEDSPAFELSRVEIDRPGPHYALETVRILAAQNPGADLFYLIGEDSLRDLPTWRQPQQFVAALAGLGVMRRPGGSADLDAVEQALPGIRAKVYWVDAPLLEISSHQIRQRVAEGRPYRYFVPPAVAKGIEAMRLYQTV